MDEKRRLALLARMPKLAAEIERTMRSFSDGTNPFTPRIIVTQVGPTSLVSYAPHQQSNRSDT